MKKEPEYGYRPFGHFFVRYNDGEISRLMPLSTAKDYAEIFGGKVERHSQTSFIKDFARGALALFLILCIPVVFVVIFVLVTAL